MQAATPMLKQYLQIKANHQDSILFFRLGDFYEMFFEDAKDASAILDLVLTSRGQSGGEKIPMCGIPFHSAENYIAKLIKAGRKVAICEQVEDAGASKGIVKRDVIRTITAGTYLDDSTDSRYLMCINPNGKSVGIAFTDNAGGTIQTNQFTNFHQTIELISKLPICECIYPESQEDAVRSLLNHPLLKTKNMTLTRFADWAFNTDMARKGLCDHFGTHSLKGFGIDDFSVAQGSCGALLEYLKQMNKKPLKHIDRISLYSDDDYVFISPAAHYGLEMESLLKTLDHTHTPMGRRLFRFWLYHPLKNVAAIAQRQYAIKFLTANEKAQNELTSSLLRNIPDLEKGLSRLSAGCGSPKDLLSIRNALNRCPQIKKVIDQLGESNSLLKVADIPQLRSLLDLAVNPDMPLAKNEGKVIREGFNTELDELRDLQENGRAWLRDFQARETVKTGINSLKVGYNKVFGYYIEVTKTHQDKVPDDYIRKQTLVNAERYITQELKDYESKILSAQDNVIALEKKLIDQLINKVLDDTVALHAYCEQLARLDVLTSLSSLAQYEGYILPEITEDFILDIQDGRHPVVEQMTTDAFIANDTLLDCEEQHLMILTGPNMSGKSTYIRQTAILVIMAQMGSFIPASKAVIGYVDKIFTRIGAHDEIAKGQSTFMVEMTETADVLNNLSPRSLIILDEIGRGTSTFDGLSLAWALAEYLQSQKVRTMFATHFHELTSLADQMSGVKNYNVAVKEWEDKVIFMHKIIPGGTDDSYGIYVAKLAGIPDAVIKRSKTILTELELKGDIKNKLSAAKSVIASQFDFFGNPPSQGSDPSLSALKEELETLDVNALTPIEALNKLSELKKKLSDG